MIFEPLDDGQKRMLETEELLTVVVGGAGTGKTTVALAAARMHLEKPQTAAQQRVLFLSFSRASVARISDQSQGILGDSSHRIDILTFHALAYSIVRRFGSVVGVPKATLVSPAREKIGLRHGDIGYGQLIPLALEIIRTAPAVAANLRNRWSFVIVDEFQDTGDLQQEILDEISLRARRMLLGDPNQCIYTFLRSDGVKLERINEAISVAGPENTIHLPDSSYRDPTGVIPGIARAIQSRNFRSPVLRSALDEGRLQVRSRIALSDETDTVASVVQKLKNEGFGVAVFTHHNDMLASLSDGLEAQGIDHDIAGLSDALAGALDVQVAFMMYAANLLDWEGALDSLAVFVTSASRGRHVPQLALDILHGSGARTLQERLEMLRLNLKAPGDISSWQNLAAEAHHELGLPNKSNAWVDAATLLGPMRARAQRQLGLRADHRVIVTNVATAAREATIASLTDSRTESQRVQLMNLYQTKGREADVTVVVLREGDFLGSEGEPFPATSRLLYVVFSRARERIIVLLVGSRLHPAVAPLLALSD